jgi:hypothetical protein
MEAGMDVIGGMIEADLMIAVELGVLNQGRISNVLRR